MMLGSVVNADIYLAGVEEWEVFDITQKTSKLVEWTLIFNNSFNWLGGRTDIETPQEDCFPRTGIYIDGIEVDDSSLPLAVENSLYEMIKLDLEDGVFGEVETTKGGVSKLKLSVLEIEENTSTDYDAIDSLGRTKSQKVNMYLKPYLHNTGGSTTLLRM